MKKIRIPRKKKKFSYRRKLMSQDCYPCCPKLFKYYSFLSVEYGMKAFRMEAEELYWNIGRYSMDDIIWWHYVRFKHFGIKPKMSEKFKEYWNDLVLGIR